MLLFLKAEIFTINQKHAQTTFTVFSACENGHVLCNGLLYHSKIIIVNAPFYCNHLTIKILFCRRKFQGLTEKVTRLLHTKWSLEEYS